MLEFKFVVTGGDASDIYGLGSIGGVIFHLTSNQFMNFDNFNDSFEENWDNKDFDSMGYGLGTADTFFIEVPEPATLGLMAFGLGLIARKRRS